MPRQRKPQNGGQRLWTGRVANTTTGSTTTQTVYRIPSRNYGECEKLAYEILGTSPIRVSIEWEDIYRISLDEEALKQIIENYDWLDLSNVTLQTVNGNVEFTWNVTVDWTFTWTSATFDSITSTTGEITTLTSTDATITNVSASDVSTATLETSWNASVWWDLTVTWSSTLSWVTVNGDISTSWDITTANIVATTWTIETLASTDATIDSLAVNNSATVADGLTVTWGLTTDTLETSWNATIGWDISIAWASTFTGDITVNNITSTWTANLNDAVIGWNETVVWTMTVNWTSTLTWNTSVGGNLSVSWNETVTGNSTVTWDAIFSSDVSIAEDLTVTWDATIADDLIVNGSTHLKTLETTGSASLGWNLSVDWSIAGWSSLVVENQIESGSLVTTNIVTDNITVNGNIALWNDATAPDFILQSEKWQPNGVCPLDANGLVDPQYLPPIYTTAIVKVGTWIFSNSDTSVVVDADITADSFVIISNYSDIVWDLNEVINVGQLTVMSNQTETWSYKYIIVNALSNS